MVRISKKVIALLALASVAVIGMNGYVLANMGTEEEQTLGSYVDELRERGCDSVQIVWEDDGGINITWMQGNLMFASRLH